MVERVSFFLLCQVRRLLFLAFNCGVIVGELIYVCEKDCVFHACVMSFVWCPCLVLRVALVRRWTRVVLGILNFVSFFNLRPSEVGRVSFEIPDWFFS